MQITKTLILISLFYTSCVQASPARRRKTPLPKGPLPPLELPVPPLQPPAPPAPPAQPSSSTSGAPPGPVRVPPLEHGEFVKVRVKDFEPNAPKAQKSFPHPGVVVGGPDSADRYKVAMISNNLPGNPKQEHISKYQPGTTMDGSVSLEQPKDLPGHKLKNWIENSNNGASKGEGSSKGSTSDKPQGKPQPKLTAEKLKQLKTDMGIDACPVGKNLSRRGCVPGKPTAKKGVKVTATKGGSKGTAQLQKAAPNTGGVKPKGQAVKKGGVKPTVKKTGPQKVGAKKSVQKSTAKPKGQSVRGGGTKLVAQKPALKNAAAKKHVRKVTTKPQAQKPVPKNAAVKKPVQKSMTKPQTQKLTPKSTAAKRPSQNPPAKPQAQKPTPRNAAAKKPVQKSQAKPPVAKPPAQKQAPKPAPVKPAAKAAPRKH